MSIRRAIAFFVIVMQGEHRKHKRPRCGSDKADSVNSLAKTKRIAWVSTHFSVDTFSGGSPYGRRAPICGKPHCGRFGTRGRPRSRVNSSHRNPERRSAIDIAAAKTPKWPRICYHF